MDDVELPNHLFIGLRHEFEATRVIDRRLSPTRIKIKTDVSPTEDDEDDVALELALSKIHYFVQNILDGSIILSADNDWAASSFMLRDNGWGADNDVVLCPETPTDACLAELILCKFKSLAGDALNFHSIEVESTDSRNMSFLFVGANPCDEFPTGQEWLSPRNFFSKPWWFRDDASTIDVIPNDGDDVDAPPSWAYSLGFLAERVAMQMGRPDNVVVRPEFRPKVIEGGKTD